MGPRARLVWVATVAMEACWGGRRTPARTWYWSDDGSSSIGRANLDGSGANQSFITGAIIPLGVAVDDQHIYWTNRLADTIGRANLDGSSVNQSFIGANVPGSGWRSTAGRPGPRRRARQALGSGPSRWARSGARGL